jgi:hypothetical protein
MGTRPSGLYPGILGEPSPVTVKSWRPFRRGGTWFLLAVRSWLQNSCRFQRLRVVEIFLSLLVQIQTHPTPEMDYGILILRGRFLGGSFRESSAGALSTSRVVLFDYWTSSVGTKTNTVLMICGAMTRMTGLRTTWTLWMITFRRLYRALMIDADDAPSWV